MGGKGSGRRPAPKPIDELGANARKIMAYSEIQALNDQNPVSMKSAKAIYKRYNEFIEICAKYDIVPVPAGFAAALGVSRQHLHQLDIGVTKTSPEVREVINRCYSLLNALSETNMLEGKTPPASAIYHTANNFDGYVDAKEVRVAAQPLEEPTTTAQLAEKYSKVIEAIDVDYEEVQDENS